MKAEDDDVKLDVNIVIESLQRQVADKAKEVAMRDGMIARQNEHIQQLQSQVDELAKSLSSTKINVNKADESTDEDIARVREIGEKKK